MAAAFRSLAFTTYATRTNTTVNAPAGVVDGDMLLMFLFLAVAGTPPTPSLPAGWTALPGAFPVTGTDGSFTAHNRIYYKIASGEPANYTITHTNCNSCALVYCASGVDTGSAPVVTLNSGTGFTSTALGLTPVNDNALIVYADTAWNLYGGFSPPTGTTPTFTERQDDATAVFYLADGNLSPAGATGDKSHTNNNSISNQPWAAFLLSLEPAGVIVPTGGWNPILTQANPLKTLGAK